MALRITGKHMDLGDTLRARIEDRIAEAIEKYFGHGFSGHVTVEKTGSQYEADCALRLDSGMKLEASATDNDATAAFDKACERIEKRLRRYKRRLKDHHAGASSSVDVAYAIMETPQEDEEVAEDFAPVVVAEQRTVMHTQTVAMAVMQLDMMDSPVHIFRNAASGSINVVYKRADGNVGWLDPGASESGNAA